MKNIVKIKRALISVSDKSLLENLLPFLSEYKIEIISSGKTYKKIKKLGFQKADVYKTHGNNNKIKRKTNFKRFTDFNLALSRTHEWFKSNHKMLK